MALTPEQQQQMERYEKLKRNVAIGCLIACPTLIAMPPRKLDWYTFGLGLAFVFSTDHLVTSSTGRGLYHHIRSPTPSLPTERARELHRALQEQETLKQGKDAMKDLREQEEKTKGGLLSRVWMGDEKEGWKERRMQEERDALESGKSYQDMILDQIWEVWNWDKKKESNDSKSQTQEPQTKSSDDK